MEELLEARNNSELPYPLATRAFEQMARYPRPYLALLSDVENSYFSVQLQEYMSAMARPLLETTLREKGLQTSLDAGMIIGYLTGALRGLGRWWLEAGQPYPPAELARWFVETVRTGLNSLNPPQLETKEYVILSTEMPPWAYSKLVMVKSLTRSPLTTMPIKPARPSGRSNSVSPSMITQGSLAR